MDRRSILNIAGSTVAVGFAGCLHGDGQSDGEWADTGDGSDGGDGSGGGDFEDPPENLFLFDWPQDVVRSFHHARDEVPDDASGEDLVAEFEKYLHSESPWRDIWAEMSADEMRGAERAIDLVDIEGTRRDLSAEQLRAEFDWDRFEVSDEAFEMIADSYPEDDEADTNGDDPHNKSETKVIDKVVDNAFVEASIRYVGGEVETWRHLTVQEITERDMNEWQIFI